MSRLRLSSGGLPESFQKVVSIKALRLLTGIGLKEAKDAIEAAMIGELVSIQDGYPRDSEMTNYEAHTNLKKNGLELVQGTTKIEFIIEAVKEIAKMAADEEEEQLAILLLDILRQHKENVRLKEKQYKDEQEDTRQRMHAERLRQEEVARISEQQEQRWHNENRRGQKNAPMMDDRI